MKETYGVPVEEIQEGIRHGVRKVNIDTDIRLAMTAAIRKFLHDNPSKFDPREYLKPAMRGGEGDLQGALRAVRLRGHGVEDQARGAGANRGPISKRRAGAGGAVTRPAPRGRRHAVARVQGEQPASGSATA